MKGLRWPATRDLAIVTRSEPNLSPSPSRPPDIAELYRAHAPSVARWATRLGGPAVDPEDVVHEVFLVAHRRLGDFRGEAKPATWLFRTTHLIVRAHRRKSRLRTWLTRSVADNGASQGSGASVLTPVELLIERQRAAQVYRALDGLGEKYRLVLVLFELEGLSGEQIASLTGIKVATVWVRLHRARALFLARVRAMSPAEEDRA